MILKIHLTSTRNNILGDNLTDIDTDHIEVQPLQKELFRLCQEHSGIGISANQVGLRKNFFFVTSKAKFPNKRGGKPVAHLCIRPSWEPEKGAEQVALNEGCLSLPSRTFKVMRYPVIIASWTNAVGHRVENQRLKGLAAQVFQHEHDHLRGITLLQSGTEVQ